MITFLIFCLGLITVYLSVIIAKKFHDKFKTFNDARNRGFSLALCAQLVGEAVMGLGTLTFAAAAHFGWLEGWSVEFQSTLRFIMFFATASTSIHLYRTIEKLKSI